MTSRAIAAAAVAVVLVLALLWSFSQRPNPVSAPPSTSASPTASASASTTPISSPASSAITQPTAAATETITGQLGYPSEFVPPLTVYAISVNDPNVWYSTNTPFFGSFTRPTPSPTPSFAATWPPTGDGRYQLSVPAGTYYVIAYSNDTGLPKDLAAAYTRYTIDCIQKAGPNSPPPACSGNDHTLVPVAVQVGQTASGIDIKDWQLSAGTYPPRPAPR